MPETTTHIQRALHRARDRLLANPDRHCQHEVLNELMRELVAKHDTRRPNQGTPKCVHDLLEPLTDLCVSLCRDGRDLHDTLFELVDRALQTCRACPPSPRECLQAFPHSIRFTPARQIDAERPSSRDADGGAAA